VRGEENMDRESARAVLLRDVEPLDYSSADLHPTLRLENDNMMSVLPERQRINQLPRGLFDDV
jgi:hypothetical protein